ncbi:hypothetical protein VDG1235_297 [Verrucomicrobiia bacterium DG1235]|nr:hypothetical protein VDG1235_297 [Verrucomicrobiae bacterium DG1235]
MNRFLVKPFALTVAFLVLSPFFSQAQDSSDEPELTEAERAQKVEETVALARKYLGGAAKLDAIKTIHSQGVLVYGNGASGTVESVFKSPNYHQFVSVINGSKETTSLNRTEAWIKVESLSSPNTYSLDFYGVDDVRHLEATVIDSLSFLKIPPTRNGRIEYLGTGEVKGEQAIVLQYIHSDRIWFRRFIDPETGRVMHMVNDKGVVFSYEGELEVDGVVFPKTTIVRSVTQFGEQTMEISYSSIKINESIDTERFRVPTTYE